MIVRFLVNALSLAVATWLMPGIVLADGPMQNRVLTIAVVAAIFGVVNALVKPLFVFIASPLLLLTLGLFLLVVNASLLLLTSWVCGKLGVGWYVTDFWSAVWGALLVSVVSFFLNSFVTNRGEAHQ